MEKLVFVPFSWVIYLLFCYNDPFKFSVYESVFCRLLKELVVSSALHQCLVFFPPTFTENFTNFNLNEFSHFLEYLKQRDSQEKKSWIAEILFLRRTLMALYFQGPEKIFKYRGKPWTGNNFKFLEKLVFVPFSLVVYLLFCYNDPFKFSVYESVFVDFWRS